jgi:hypothetical protein
MCYRMVKLFEADENARPVLCFAEQPDQLSVLPVRQGSQTVRKATSTPRSRTACCVPGELQIAEHGWC